MKVFRHEAHLNSLFKMLINGPLDLVLNRKGIRSHGSRHSHPIQNYHTYRFWNIAKRRFANTWEIRLDHISRYFFIEICRQTYPSWIGSPLGKVMIICLFGGRSFWSSIREAIMWLDVHYRLSMSETSLGQLNHRTDVVHEFAFHICRFKITINSPGLSIFRRVEDSSIEPILRYMHRYVLHGIKYRWHKL